MEFSDFADDYSKLIGKKCMLKHETLSGCYKKIVEIERVLKRSFKIKGDKRRFGLDGFEVGRGYNKAYCELISSEEIDRFTKTTSYVRRMKNKIHEAATHIYNLDMNGKYIENSKIYNDFECAVNKILKFIAMDRENEK